MRVKWRKKTEIDGGTDGGKLYSGLWSRGKEDERKE